MLKANAVKKLAICSLVSTVAMGSSAMAHTSIQASIKADKSGATEATINNLVIGHGCTDHPSNIKHPVIAQSVLFPTVSPQIFVDSSPTPSSLKVTDLITSSTGLAKLPQLIQNTDIFKKQSEKHDSLNNVIGFNSYSGKLSTDLHGLVPFRFGAVTFKTPIADLTNECVNKLVIKVAVADICKTSFPSGGPKEGQANLWIPNTTVKFHNVLDGTSANALEGEPAELIIDNSSACETGSTVTIWPSDSDIDTNLIIPKIWGK